MPAAILLTPTGRGAVASIVYDGPPDLIEGARLFRAANAKPLGQQPVNRIVFGHWGSDPGEEVVLCRVSPTRLEIHCHGGHAAGEAILHTLVNLGCERRTGWDDLEHTGGVFERLAAHALAHAPTPRAAAIIAHQTAGPLKAALAKLANEQTAVDDFRATIENLLHWADFGRHLFEPWQVVLFGRPNVGKSSLMNALAGFKRAIVLDSPGTTRDLVTAELALDGWPIRLTDTAGLRADADELETSGINRAKTYLPNADLGILVLDRAAAPTHEELELINTSPGAIIVANKSDLQDAWQAALPPGAIPLSAKTGHGLEALARDIVNRLVPQAPDKDVPVPIVPRLVESLISARAALIDDDHLAARRTCQSVEPR